MKLTGNWLRFDARPQERLFSRVHITINHKGQIHLGRNAHEVFGRPQAAALYYEPELCKIALEPVEARTRGCLRLVPKGFGAVYISAATFCRRNLIEIVGTHAFKKPEINHNGILILDLNETERVGGWVSNKTAEKYRDTFARERREIPQNIRAPDAGRDTA